MNPKKIISHIMYASLGIAAIFLIRINNSTETIKLSALPSPSKLVIKEKARVYHELTIIYRSWFNYKLLILNDMDNVLSEEEFSKLDEAKIKKSLAADIVRINGPKYALFDEFIELKPAEKRELLGYEWSLLASSDLTLVADINVKSYERIPVSRYSTYIYKKGSKVYELISDKGEIYTMLDFSKAVDHKQTLESLTELGEYLSLPEGWSYRSRVLHDDLVLNSERNSYVTQDEYLNTYQKTSTAKIYVAH